MAGNKILNNSNDNTLNPILSIINLFQSGENVDVNPLNIVNGDDKNRDYLKKVKLRNLKENLDLLSNKPLKMYIEFNTTERITEIVD